MVFAGDPGMIQLHAGSVVNVVDASRQQRPIHYSGNFSHDKRHVAGVWRFKTGILWTRWRPLLYGGSGTWTMEKVD